MNRVSQVYEDDLSITSPADRADRPPEPQHVGRGDRAERAVRRRGVLHPGERDRAAATSVATASSSARSSAPRTFDIGHLALGQPGGGVANLGVVGRANKAGGCTGIPTPTGDFYAIDYVAHEMGHQFSGNHPFNGNQLNCSGGNRSARHLGRARLRLVDHGVRRHLPRPTTSRPTATRTSRSGASRRSRPTRRRTRRRSTRSSPPPSATSAAATRSRSRRSARASSRRRRSSRSP